MDCFPKLSRAQCDANRWESFLLRYIYSSTRQSPFANYLKTNKASQPKTFRVSSASYWFKMEMRFGSEFSVLISLVMTIKCDFLSPTRWQWVNTSGWTIEMYMSLYFLLWIITRGFKKYSITVRLIKAHPFRPAFVCFCVWPKKSAFLIFFTADDWPFFTA